MSDTQRNVHAGLYGLVIGTVVFFLFWFVLLPIIEFPSPNFPQDWYIFVLPLLAPPITAVSNSYDLERHFSENLLFVGKLLLASLAINVINFICALLVGFIYTFLTGTFLDYVLVAFILGIFGAPIYWIVGFIFGG